MLSFPFDEEKAISAVLYIIQQLNGKVNRHKLAKILYFADQKHMVLHGRPVIGDSYVAMKDGPVPSKVYDGIKAIDDDRYHFPLFRNNLSSEKFWIYSDVSPDMDELSRSDVKCLDESIMDNKDLGYGYLRTKSHKMAWDKAGLNNKMSIINIALEGGAHPDMALHIKENAEDFQSLL